MRRTGGHTFRPVFPAQRIGRLLAGVGVLPLIDQQAGRGVRRAAQRVVFNRPQPGLDFVDLGADRDHRLAERVDLGQALAFRRLNHQRAGHREAHSRSVKAEVGQPLCDVVDGDAGVLRDRAQIQDALVGHHPVLAGVEHRVDLIVEAAGDVVGERDRGQRRPAQARGAHHPDVGPRDGQDRRRAVRRRRNRWLVGQLASQWMARQVGPQVLTHRDGSDFRAAAAVRDAERLVQVQVADARRTGRAWPARPAR